MRKNLEKFILHTTLLASCWCIYTDRFPMSIAFNTLILAAGYLWYIDEDE